MGELEPTTEQIDVMARAVHEQYLADNADDPDHPAMVAWDELDPPRRLQNHDQVRHTIHSLRSAGFELVPADSVSAERVVAELPADTVERLAEAEHGRWCQKKRAAGYRYGETTVDVGDDLRHPNLVAWVDLDERDRDKDRRPIADFPRVVQRSGWALVGPAT